MCFWVKRSTESRNVCGKMEIFNCIGQCVLGQRRYEQSRRSRQAESFGVRFWVQRYTKGRDSSGELKALDCILRKYTQKFNFLAFPDKSRSVRRA